MEFDKKKRQANKKLASFKTKKGKHGINITQKKISSSGFADHRGHL
jgi:hypothetical protein